MDAIGNLYALAARQHQALRTNQGANFGLSSSTTARVLRRQGWDRDSWGIWTPPGSLDTPLRATSAALLAAGPRAAATGPSGLWLHGAIDDPPEYPTIVVPKSTGVPRHLADGIHVIESRSYAPKNNRPVQRLHVTPLERSLGDWCLPETPELDDVRDVIITSVQRRATTPAELREELVRLKGMPGIETFRLAILDAVSTGADSPFTLRVQRRLQECGLDPDDFPVPVQTQHALLHPDITFLTRRGKKVSVECDGLAVHGTGRGQADDHRKDRAYKSADWDNKRLGWWEFTNRWDAFLADLVVALER